MPLKIKSTKEEIKSWVNEEEIINYLAFTGLINHNLLEEPEFQQVELNIFEKGIKCVETDYQDTKKENYEIKTETKQNISNSQCIIKEIGKYQEKLTNDNFVIKTNEAIVLKNSEKYIMRQAK